MTLSRIRWYGFWEYVPPGCLNDYGIRVLGPLLEYKDSGFRRVTTTIFFAGKNESNRSIDICRVLIWHSTRAMTMKIVILLQIERAELGPPLRNSIMP